MTRPSSIGPIVLHLLLFLLLRQLLFLGNSRVPFSVVRVKSSYILFFLPLFMAEEIGAGQGRLIFLSIDATFKVRRMGTE